MSSVNPLGILNFGYFISFSVLGPKSPKGGPEPLEIIVAVFTSVAVYESL